MIGVSRCSALREVGIRQIASAHPFFSEKGKGTQWRFKYLSTSTRTTRCRE